MKNIFSDITEAMTIVDMISQFDSVAVQSILCMSIDTVGALTGQDPVEIAENIYTAVTAVNAEYGAYTF